MTLLKVTPSVGWHYARLARLHGVEADPLQLDAAFRSAWRHCRANHPAHPQLAYGHTQEEALQFWSQVIRQTFTLAGIEPPATDSYYQQVFDAFASAECWQLYPDVAEALDLLRERGVPWGILSNWDGRLRRTVAELELLAGRSTLMISSEVGAEKPDRRIFAAAETAASGFSRFGLIGDEPVADGEGARAAGWAHCLVWRGSDPPPPGLRSAPTLVQAVHALLFSPQGA
jgi:putative hydrolase of the HAD superfamily